MFAASKTAAAAAGTPPASTDPQFNYVTMLLHGDGTNGAQNNTFVDSSTNNFTITRNGTPTQGSFSPYGDLWSNFFASGQFLAMSANTAFVLDSSFTVEAWVCLSAVPALDADSKARGCVLSYYQNTNTSGYQLVVNKTDNLVTFFRNQTGTGIACSYNIQVGVWYHIAVVYNGTTGSIYIDGVAQTTTTNNWSWVAPSTPTLRIGALTQSSYLQYFPGYISNVRIVKGTALYTSNFTPSTTPLTAVSGTSLLTCQSNRFRDASSNNFAITVTGTPSVQRFSPFDPAAEYSTSVIGGSAWFDGSGDYLTNSYTTSAFDWWTTDFTVESWVYPTSFTGWSYTVGAILYPSLVGNMQATGNVNYWSFGPTSAGGLSFVYYNGTNQAVTSTNTLRLSQWNHIAMTKTSSGVTLFVNGVSQTTVAISGTPQSSTSVPMTVGQYQNAAINGYVSNLRIVKGSAVYTTNFTPPTAPLTAITNTSLLLNCVNAGIVDNAMMNALVTVGNAQVSTSVKKYGTGSLAFDGSGDYINSPANSSLYSMGAGNFTIEFWLYFISAPSGWAAAVSLRTTTSNTFTNDPNGIYIGANEIGAAVKVAGAVTSVGSLAATPTNTWGHVALVRDGNQLKMFYNGVQSGSSVAFSSSITSNLVLLGTDEWGARGTLNGYIDDLRITKGVARYTANFTPPTAPFPNN